MLFTQLFFWGFFLLVLAFYTLVYQVPKRRSLYLLAVSLFFYFKTSGVFVLLLLFTICNDYFLAKKIHNAQDPSKKKWFLSISVITNLSLLCYFKYAYFFHESYNSLSGSSQHFFNHFAAFSNTFFGTDFSLTKLLLPVGVSFFTFQSLSYTIDMYRGKTQPVQSIFDYGFFVCFFPHLVAGPIVKAHDFIHQIYQPYRLTKTEFGMAVFWILNGFCKKIVADYIAVNYIDRIFDNPGLFSGAETVAGIFGYSLQIYMDFSGYTDMAIGIAWILGYRLKTNFKSPYKATSTSEFWKRWHISLSSWLQEYLYIPMGGNRNGSFASYLLLFIILLFLVMLSAKWWLFKLLMFVALALAAAMWWFPSVRKGVSTNVNLMVTMLLGGLWHGSSTLFIVWGGLNGLGLIVHKYWEKISPFKNSASILTKGILMLVTLSFISFTRIFFRSNDMQTVEIIFQRLSHSFGAELIPQMLQGYKSVFALMLLGYLIHWIPESVKVRYREWFASRSYPVMTGIILLLVLLMYQLMSGEMQPFIYFQF